MSWPRSYARATRAGQRVAANGGRHAGSVLAATRPGPHHGGMRTIPPLLTAAALLAASATVLAQPPAPDPAAVAAAGAALNAPTYVDDKLVLPANYREWIYLTSGFDMSYSANAKPGHHMFDNVFVNPEAYREFLKTGTWPDKTTILIEVRGARTRGSINQSGQYQDADVMGHELHVKDEARFPGKWAFFSFEDERPAAMVARDVACYSCHEKHAAVDTTFVQFYPTLMAVAKARGTLSASYLAETAKPER
jgi:hypothetical protein